MNCERTSRKRTFAICTHKTLKKKKKKKNKTNKINKKQKKNEAIKGRKQK
jgi:hypothetical protein